MWWVNNLRFVVPFCCGRIQEITSKRSNATNHIYMAYTLLCNLQKKTQDNMQHYKAYTWNRYRLNAKIRNILRFKSLCSHKNVSRHDKQIAYTLFLYVWHTRTAYRAYSIMTHYTARWRNSQKQLANLYRLIHIPHTINRRLNIQLW